MNLRWYDRVLIALSGLLLAALGVLATLMGGGVVRPESFTLDFWLGDGWQWMPVIVLGGLLLLAWGVWMIIRPFVETSDTSGRYYILKDRGDGEVQISVQALDHLVHRALGVWPEILSAHVRIGGQEDAMHITLRTTIQANVRIPELIGEVRAKIKQYVEECAGVRVESVKVIIVATKDAKQDEGKATLQSEGVRGVTEPERAAGREAEAAPHGFDVPAANVQRTAAEEAVDAEAASERADWTGAAQPDAGEAMARPETNEATQPETNEEARWPDTEEETRDA